MQQHEDALKRANEVRLARAVLRREAKTNPCRVLDVIEETPDWCRTIEVGDLLVMLPRWGRNRTRRFLRTAQTPEGLRLQAVTPRQREMMLDHLRWLYLA
jgi:hypothetical protein